MKGDSETRTGVTILVGAWLAYFGVWPLAHPRHDTFFNPVTWVDWALHITGLVIVVVLAFFPPTPGPQVFRTMRTMPLPEDTPLPADDPFNVELADWLNTETPPMSYADPSAPALGFFAFQDAVADARTHTACTPEVRMHTLNIGVTGTDGVNTLQSLRPGDGNVGCVLGALNRDPRVAEMRLVSVEARLG